MDDEQITTSVRPTDIMHGDIYDAEYVSSGNRVVDLEPIVAHGHFITAEQFADAVDTTSINGRSSIKYSNEMINLFFPLTTTYMQ